MSCTKISKSINLYLNQVSRNFLWVGNVKGRKMSLAKWDVVTLSKRLGGLGIQDFKMINLTMLDKLA